LEPGSAALKRYKVSGATKDYVHASDVSF